MQKIKYIKYINFLYPFLFLKFKFNKNKKT